MYAEMFVFEFPWCRIAGLACMLFGAAATVVLVVMLTSKTNSRGDDTQR